MERVILKDTKVVKQQDVKTAKCEHIKTIIALQLSKLENNFDVPKVVGVNLDKGLIEFERFYGFQNLRQKLFENKICNLSLMRRVAEILYFIHTSPIDKLQGVHASDYFKCCGQALFLHGDFSLINVFINANDDLCIIDWCSPTWINDQHENTIYTDISIFICSIFVKRIFSRKRIKNKAMYAKEFLDMYGNLHNEFDKEEFAKSFYEIIRQYKLDRKNKDSFIKYFLYYYSFIAMHRFIRKYC